MNIILTKDELADLVAHYLSQPAFAFDVETWGEHRGSPVRNDVLWISLATEDRVDVIPMGHPNGEFTHWEKPLLAEGKRRKDKGLPLRDPQDYSSKQDLWTPHFTEPPEQLSPGEVFSALRPLFFGDALKIGHNIKFDLKSVAKYFRGEVPSRPHFDTLTAAFIIDNRTKHGLGLDDCAKRELGIEVKKGIGKYVERHTFDDVATYSALDAEATYALYKIYRERIIAKDLTAVWDLEMDVLAFFVTWNLPGPPLTREGFRNYIEKYRKI